MNEWTEKLIDAHLEAPNVAQPTLGFESRVLTRVAEHKVTWRSPMLWMVWASAAAAVIIVAIVLSRPRVQEPAPIETAEIAAPLPSTVSSPVATTSPALPHPTARPRQTLRAFEVDDRPTQFFGPVSSDGFFGARMSTAGTFPSASPLSDQEQMLVAMVSRMTGQQQRALAEALEASRIPDPLPKSVPESSVRPASEIKNTH